MYVLMNGSQEISQPMTKEGAIKRKKEVSMIYPHAEIKRTEKQAKNAVKIDSPAEVVEDVGCSGGGCAL